MFYYLQDTPRKKKRRSSIGSAVEKLDLIAMGTLSGDVILYSVVKGDIHTQLASIYEGYTYIYTTRRCRSCITYSTT